MRYFLFVAILLCAVPAHAAFWDNICDAKDSDGIMACYNKERERIAKESEESDKELLAYCIKNSSNGCKALEEAITSRKKAEKAAKTYRESLDGLKQGLETIGDSVGNALRQGSENISEFFGGGKDKN